MLLVPLDSQIGFLALPLYSLLGCLAILPSASESIDIAAASTAAAAEDTCERNRHDHEDELSLLQTFPGWVRRPVPRGPGNEVWQQHLTEYSQQELSSPPGRDSYGFPSRAEQLQGASSSPPDANMYGGREEPLPSFAQSGMDVSASHQSEMRQESMLRRKVQEDLAEQDALDQQEWAMRRASGGAGYPAAPPQFFTEEAANEAWERRQAQASLQRTAASRASESMIEKQAELEVSDALNIASERVRQAQAKAMAAMQAQRLDGYDQPMQADDAAASLLSIDSEVIYPAAGVPRGGRPSRGRRRKVQVASNCGIKKDLDCTKMNRTITWGYTTHYSWGLLLWIIFITVAIACCCTCVSCAATEGQRFGFGCCWLLLICGFPAIAYFVLFN